MDLADPAPACAAEGSAAAIDPALRIASVTLAVAETVRRVAGARWPFEGASDHGVSEALYLSDPDGLGIEIYADRRRELWQRPADGRGVSMVTLALDLDDLLAQFTGEPAAAMPADTGVGHVHLKTADVPRAAAFYRDALDALERAVADAPSQPPLARGADGELSVRDPDGELLAFTHR